MFLVEVRGLTVSVLTGALKGNPKAKNIQESIETTRSKEFLSTYMKTLQNYEAKLEKIMFELRNTRKETPRKIRSGLIGGSKHKSYTRLISKLRGDRDDLICHIKVWRRLVEETQIQLQQLQEEK